MGNNRSKEEEEGKGSDTKKVLKVVLASLEGVPANRFMKIQKFVELLLDAELALVLALLSKSQVANIESLVRSLLKVFEYEGSLDRLFIRFIESEVTDKEHFFRGYGIKLLGAYVKREGSDYAASTLTPPIEQICKTSYPTEIDPLKLDNPGDAVANGRNLLNYTEIILSVIFDSVPKFPWKLRKLCYNVKTIVTTRFPDRGRMAVAHLVIHRLLVPFIMVSDAAKTPSERRTLVIISKIIQNLANEIKFTDRYENYMMFINPFLSEKAGKFAEFLDAISTLPDTPPKESNVPVSKPELIEALNLVYTESYSNRVGISEELTKNEQTSLMMELQSIFEEVGSSPIVQIKEK